jgi:hypothetical protein
MTDKQHSEALIHHRAALAAKFAKVMADCRREDERDAAAHAVLIECGNCEGSGIGRLFSACISCRGSGVIEEEE